MTDTEWFRIQNIADFDSPALAVYPERVKENIRILKSFIPDVSRLRPHAKTHKSAEVARLLLEEGIKKFKCATIAEAEMLAQAKAPDVLLAYQPLGPKANRLAALIRQYRQCSFSTLVDNPEAASHLSQVAVSGQVKFKVFLDLNIGMDRTGISPAKALELFHFLRSLPGLEVVGLHAYDGQLRDTDLTLRKEKCDKGFLPVEKLATEIAALTGQKPTIVAGGTPSFPIHAKRKDVECSPGTFIFWDKGYGDLLPEQPFLYAALVITRVVSLSSPGTICTDLGHKSIASENPIDRRVHFLNASELAAIRHSEEHLVLQSGNKSYEVGHVLYGVPYHICPTTALYDRLHIVEGGRFTSTWQNRARDRVITV